VRLNFFAAFVFVFIILAAIDIIRRSCSMALVIEIIGKPVVQNGWC